MSAGRIARRAAAAVGVALVAVLLVGVVLGCCVFTAPRYRGPVSAHFDGQRFHNPPPADEPRGFGAGARWLLTRKPSPWRPVADAVPGPPPPARVGTGELRVTFVNHATVLIQLDGINVLTDPIWAERASPVSFAGPRRVRPPGVRFEDLPPIDLVIVSHNHWDHCDIPTLRRLAARFNPHVVSGLGNRTLFEREGIARSVELDWWQKVDLPNGVVLWSVPVQHFSGRGLGDRNATLWTGFVLAAPAGNVYFGGDTAYGPHFRQAAERLGPFRLAILPVGAFLPRRIMAPVHMSPAEAVRAAGDLGGPPMVPIHYGTFPLADDAQDEPIVELRQAIAAARAAPERFWILGFGEGRDVPHL